MNHVQDPKRQVGYPLQCLSIDKKPRGLLLGAGCPVAVGAGADGKSPLIPQVAVITKLARDELIVRIEKNFKQRYRLTPVFAIRWR